jgi:signal transduction histidine kinase
MEYFIKENGFELKAEIDPNIEIIADADAIEQAALNLLSNAVKYSHDNKQIAIRLWEEG